MAGLARPVRTVATFVSNASSDFCIRSRSSLRTVFMPIPPGPGSTAFQCTAQASVGVPRFHVGADAGADGLAREQALEVSLGEDVEHGDGQIALHAEADGGGVHHR